VAGPALAAIFAAVASPRGFAGSAEQPNPDLGISLAVTCICLSFLAMALSLTSIVSDRIVIAREQRWGVPPRAVVQSRAVSRLAPAVLQAVMAVSVLSLLRPGPDRSLPVVSGWLGTAVVLAALTVASMCLGLLISTIAASAEQAVSLMSGALAVMVILCGLVIPLGAPAGVQALLAWVSYLTPTRWAISGVASHIDLNTVGIVVPDPMWTHDWHHFLVPVGVLVAASFVALLIAERFIPAGRSASSSSVWPQFPLARR